MCGNHRACGRPFMREHLFFFFVRRAACGRTITRADGRDSRGGGQHPARRESTEREYKRARLWAVGDTGPVRERSEICLFFFFFGMYLYILLPLHLTFLISYYGLKQDVGRQAATTT